ncbi:camphor resistance protein CrcB [Microcella putealis]|uniref:Fluoride-specific ion channel FluC n=1 Tax=Microcella putealis TaxID=337005 RepID=A0A4Q7LMT0_9MICO|nr:CrcB family protein [Microcella putealis]RZS56096.1 camphor resistance protein CrcB [Microcella putealis]TQM23473.1 camphor resistance protein CrcB [Microcella putealis]
MTTDAALTPGLIAAVALGGALGALVRYLVTVALAGRETPPGPVVIVNVVGSLLSGLALGALTDPTLLVVAVSGFCGGLTTFSTLSVESVQLVMDGRWRRAAGGMLVNVVAGVAAVAIGIALGGTLVETFGR